MNGSGDDVDTETMREPDPTSDRETIVSIDTSAGQAPSPDAPLIFDIKDLSVYYGDFRAVRGRLYSYCDYGDRP